MGKTIPLFVRQRRNDTGKMRKLRRTPAGELDKVAEKAHKENTYSGGPNKQPLNPSRALKEKEKPRQKKENNQRII